jgi:hypothetical protein
MKLKEFWINKLNLPIDPFTFNLAFSELLMNLDNKEFCDKCRSSFTNFTLSFKSIYFRIFNDYKTQVVSSEGLEHAQLDKDKIITDKYDTSSLSNSEKLVFYSFISGNIPLSSKVNEILVKIRLTHSYDDSKLMDKLCSLNYVSLYLLTNLGLNKFLELNEMIDKLGIYYPLIETKDNELDISIRSKLLDKFSEEISNFKVNDLVVLEKLLLD